MKTTRNIIDDHVAILDDGIKKEELTRFLEGMEDDLDRAPASSKLAYHHAYQGGLCAHIVDMIQTATALWSGTTMDDMDGEGKSINLDSIITVSILHDIHKVRDLSGNPMYVDNILQSGATSEKVPYKINEEYYNWENSKLVKDLENSPYLDTNGECKGLLWILKNEFSMKNGGIKSLALIASEAPNLLSVLSDSEINAIKYHGGAYETSKFELQGKEDLLMILMHAADMLSSRYEDETIA